MEKDVVINKEHEDFKLLMGIIAKGIDTNGGCHHTHDEFYKACDKIEEHLDYKIDKEKTLEYMEDNGGFCDCEILMNVWALA